MAKENLSATQALQSAQIFALHYLKVTWYMEKEANALKKRQSKQAKNPLIIVMSYHLIQLCAEDGVGMRSMVKRKLVKLS
jgi:hypothetical protein